MKKAKLMFTAVGIFAFVGTALAFTVRENETVYCFDPSLPPSGNQCETLTAATIEIRTVKILDDVLCTDQEPLDCSTISQPVDVYEGE